MFYTIAIEAVLKVTALATHSVPASFWIRFSRSFTFLTVFSIGVLKDNVRSSAIPKYVELNLWFIWIRLNVIFSGLLACLLFKLHKLLFYLSLVGSSIFRSMHLKSLSFLLTPVYTQFIEMLSNHNVIYKLKLNTFSLREITHVQIK